MTTMIIQFGAAFLMIWLLNWMWMFYQIIRHTPNWRDEGVDADEIVQNFMTNAPLELIEKIQTIGQANPFLFVAGITMILMGFLI